MIIAQIVGGLANQMGIYAAARALAEHHGVPLKLDLEDLARDKVRVFELDKLHTRIEIATPDEVRAVSGKSRFRFINRMRRSIRKRLSLKNDNVYREKSLHYDPAFFDLPANVYIAGNFPSIQYYANIFPLLRQEFTLQRELSAESTAWLNKITAATAVALHVRRTDYVNNPKVIAVHGSLSVAYYERAIKLLLQRIPHAEFFVFSDDPVWARDNIRVPAPTHYVDCNDAANGYQDFELMKNCQHYIIANSGFSRWAALLNPSADKLVYMPKRWTIEALLRDEDLGPPDWIRVDDAEAMNDEVTND
jgi:hypothetical protein